MCSSSALISFGVTIECELSANWCLRWCECASLSLCLALCPWLLFIVLNELQSMRHTVSSFVDNLHLRRDNAPHRSASLIVLPKVICEVKTHVYMWLFIAIYLVFAFFANLYCLYTHCMIMRWRNFLMKMIIVTSSISTFHRRMIISPSFLCHE